MTDELKPCPFCGGEAEVYVARTENYGYWDKTLACGCKNRCASSNAFSTEKFVQGEGMVSVDAETPAIAAWNIRAPAKQVVKPLVWEWRKPPSVWYADTIVGSYEVYTHGSWTFTRNRSSGRLHDGGKSAAQAEYERRILSAMTEAPETTPAEAAMLLLNAECFGDPVVNDALRSVAKETGQ